MVAPEDISRFAEIDKQAEALANKGGSRPEHDAPEAILVSVGVFVLLRLFAGVTLPDDEKAYWPVIIFTVVCGGGFYVIQRLRRNAWYKRYHRAFNDLQARDHGA
jgi:hypothetical protein